MGLQKYTAAKEDYERVLTLEPQNKKAKSDLLLIEKVCVFRQTQIIIPYCRPLVKSAYQKLILLYLNQNICGGYLKELSQ